jgi:hypothetical protein
MRKMLVRESIADLLVGKSKQEVDEIYAKEFQRKNKISIEDAQKLVNELISLDVDAELLSPNNNYVSDMPIRLNVYKIIDNPHVVTEAPTLKMAEALKTALGNLSMRDKGRFQINKEDGFFSMLSIYDAKRIISQIKEFNKE